jgi:microcystin-dependent protein
LTYRVSTRLRGATVFTIQTTVTPGGIAFNNFVVRSTFATGSSWEVLVEVFDKFNVGSLQFTVSTSAVFMHWGEGLGVGKYHEPGRGSIDAKGQIYQNDGERVLGESDVTGGMPPGTIMLWFSDNIPAAALALEGQTVTGGVNSYPALAAIYPAWVSGANLVLPDSRGRVFVGKNVGDSQFDEIGETGGAKTHTLNIGEVPNVQGAFTPHGSEGGSSLWSPSGAFGGSGQIGQYRSATGVLGGASSITQVRFNNGGGGQAHNNLQPYMVARYVVWAASSAGDYDPIVQQALVASVAALQAVPVAFEAGLSSDFLLSGTSRFVRVPFAVEYLDTANAYNPSTATFTAPIAGLYEFVVQYVTSTANGGPLIKFQVNGQTMSASGFESGGYGLNYASFGATRMFQLAAGGTVSAWIFNGNSVTLNLTAGYGNFFSGKRLH